MFDSEIHELTARVRAAFSRAGIPQPETIQWAPTPFQGQWGIGTAACFQAAAREAKADPGVNVPARAREISQVVAGQLEKPPGFARITSENAYLNAYFDTGVYARRVVDEAITRGVEFGKGTPKSERVMVEYAQPNTHHSFHIGHARNVVLGESLARLTEFAGYPTIRAAYPGDVGLGVMTCIWGYRRFHFGEEPAGVHERGQWLAGVYTEANSLVEPAEQETSEQRLRREQYDAERRELYRRWDASDPEVRQLWLMTRKWSLDEFEDILRILGAPIEVFFFESEVDEDAKRIVGELVQAGVADDERPDGPVIVKIDQKLGLTKEKFRTVVLLRSDGTTLYAAKDLALAKRKFEEFDVDRSVYVVDVRQSLHFQQVFKILELWGFPQAAQCFHLAYGFVTLPEGAMSSRLGHVVLFMDVYNEARRRVEGIIAEKNPELRGEQRQEVARQIGLGALIYALISVDNIKDIVFDWDSALSFEGQAAPYIQNAHVRANSILRKAGKLPETAAFDFELAPLEAELIDRISRFPETVGRAATEYKPLHIANYAYELARTFHAFYHAIPVLQTESTELQAARLRLTAAARQALANSLHLLGIAAPAVM
ncbi:MAG TPA: arginine--tRNA ligase [Anaerolineales bacterium]